MTEIVTAEFYKLHRLSTIVKLSTLLCSVVPLIAHFAQRLPRFFAFAIAKHTLCYQFERLTRFFAKKTVFFTKKAYYAPINFERYIVRS